MSCQCHSQGMQQAGYSGPEAQLVDYLPASLLGAGNESLNFFISGVRVGMQIRAAEMQKWTRLGVILALTFGTLTFLKHFGEK